MRAPQYGKLYESLAAMMGRCFAICKIDARVGKAGPSLPPTKNSSTQPDQNLHQGFPGLSEHFSRPAPQMRLALPLWESISSFDPPTKQDFRHLSFFAKFLSLVSLVKKNPPIGIGGCVGLVSLTFPGVSGSPLQLYPRQIARL